MSTEEAQLTAVAALARRFARACRDHDDAADIAQAVVLECLGRMRRGAWDPRVRPDALRAHVKRAVRPRVDDAARRRRSRAVQEADYLRELDTTSRVWMSPEVALDERVTVTSRGEESPRRPSQPARPPRTTVQATPIAAKGIAAARERTAPFDETSAAHGEATSARAGVAIAVTETSPNTSEPISSGGEPTPDVAQQSPNPDEPIPAASEQIANSHDTTLAVAEPIANRREATTDRDERTANRREPTGDAVETTANAAQTIPARAEPTVAIHDPSSAIAEPSPNENPGRQSAGEP